MTTLPPTEKLTPLDSSESYMLQASVEVVDGNNPELKDRALRALMTIKETLKQSVVLVPGDRLALDTRLPVAPRRP
jgi:Med18 protein